MRTPFFKVFVSFFLLVATASCGSDPVAPSMEAIAGDYDATSFTADGMNILAAGGSLTLSLGSGGTVAGSMFIPAQVGGPLQTDMAGTYTLSGNALTIDQAADTFVRDAEWTWSDGVLDGSWSGGASSVSVRLVR